MSKKLLGLAAVIMLAAMAGCIGGSGEDTSPMGDETETAAEATQGNSDPVEVFEAEYDGVDYICFKHEHTDGVGNWRAGKYGLDCIPETQHEAAKNTTSGGGF